MTKRKAPPSDTRTRILQEAVSLFANAGYNGVSMRDIARGVGTSAAALYHHFPDKETLYQEALSYAVAEKTSKLLTPLSTPLPPEVRLKGYIKALVNLFGQDPDFRRLLHREMLDGDKSRLKLLAADIFAKPVNAITELLADIAPGLDPHILLLTISGTVIQHYESAPMRRFYPDRKPEHDDPDYLIDHLSHLLLHGIMDSPGT